MRGRWATIGIASGVLAGACVDLQPYACSEDAQCRSATAQGWCEDTNFCSYPDRDCDSGRRYGDLAAELSGRCTEPPDATGSSGPEPTATSEADTGPDASTGTTGDESTSEDTAPPQPVCGNGIVEGDEECDELDAVDGDGCNTDCVRSGSVRWSVVVASDRGGNDRLFGLTQLVSGDVVAVGFFQADSRDALIMRFTVDGEEVQRVIHDVEGGLDEAEAVVQGGTGRLYVCGRATVGGVTRPWVARWDAPLTDPPAYDEALPGVSGQCHDIAYVTSGEIVAAGGTGGTAFTFTYGDGNVAGGVAATASETGQNRFKAVVRAPNGLPYVAGQVGDAAVVHQPPSWGDLGPALVQTAETVELQSMVVTDDTIYVGGLLREVESMDDLWVTAHELDGTERWRFAPALPAIDEVEDIAVDGAGNVFLTGHVVAEFPDRYVAKLDPAGELVWERSDYEGSEGDDRGRSIEVLPSGDLVVVAEVTGPGGDLDGWIARLAP